MIVWTKSTEYKKFETSEEQELFLKKIITADTFLMIKFANWLLNIIIPIVIFLFINDELTTMSKLLVLAIAFVVQDFILMIISKILFIEIPFRKAQKMSLQDIQKRLNKLINKSQYLHKTKIPMLRQKARDSEFYKGLLNLTEDTATQIDAFIKADSAFVEAELNKQRDVEMRETKTSNDYKMWSDYFIETKTRLIYFANQKQFSMLGDVIKAITALLNILEKKPYGSNKINYTLKIYFDELNIALGKIVNLSVEKDQHSYLETLQEVSKALTAEIQATIVQIDEIDKKDISTTLSTLLTELNRTEETNS